MKFQNKILVVLCAAIFFCGEAFATFIPITIEEQDGTPSAPNIHRIRVNNGKLTDLQNGTVLLNVNGDVSAASTFEDNVLLRGDGGTKGIQGSGISIDDSNNISGIGNLTSSSGRISTATFTMTTGATNNYILSSDASGNASWVNPSTLANSEFSDGGNFIYLADDSGAETIIIGSTTEANADIILGANGNVVFNEQGNDSDFRIEGVSQGNLLFADASTNRIGVNTASPNSSLQVSGSLSLPFKSINDSYTATALDHTIAVDCTSGNITISLPSASGITGRIYVFKKTDSSTNKIVLDGSGAQTIDGSGTYDIVKQYQSLTVQSTGSNWLIL